MSLHLVRLSIDLRALAAFAVAHGASDDDSGYAVHLALRRRFGEAGPQPFRLLADGPAAPVLLGYVADAAALAEAGALPATDASLDPVFPDAAQARPMPETWREGARFGFEVRARPVVRFGKTRRAARAGQTDAWQRRAGEVDAFVHACERAGEGVPVDREQVYLDWLAGRLAPAADIEGAELRLLRRVRTRRSRHGRPGLSRVEGPDAVIAGTLSVRDGQAFAALLARGVGRHVAFGFGMLLLSPPKRVE
jgi:CRISPR system Cascade subunit CasE